MGIYTSNRYFGSAYDYASEIPANEAYDAAFGCAHILADCEANDMALFESTIYSDMNEVMSIQEGYQVINENAFTDIIKKIVEMFKKLIAKIKGIFKAFIAKLDGLAKNGHDLVKKYEKQILKYSNWKQFKVKIKKPKKGSTDIVSDIGKVFNFDAATGNRYTLKTNDIASWTPDLGDALKTPDKVKDADAEDIKVAILKNFYIKTGTVSISDYKDFSEDVTDYLYEDEEKIDGDDDNISSSYFTTAWIKGVLENKKLISDAEKLNKRLNDNINGIIDDLGKTHTELAKMMSDNGTNSKVSADDTVFGKASITKDTHYDKVNLKFDKGVSHNKYDTEQEAKNAGIKNPIKVTISSEEKWVDPDDYGRATFKSETGSKATEVQKVIVAMQKIASNEQEVVTKVTSEYMAQLKFAVSQARKMWSAAAAYSSTEHKEDASYYQAVGECAAEQAYQKFEAIHS